MMDDKEFLAYYSTDNYRLTLKWSLVVILHQIIVENVNKLIVRQEMVFRWWFIKYAKIDHQIQINPINLCLKIQFDSIAAAQN